MIKLTLSDQERRQLEDTFKTTTDRRLRARCQAILMATRGRCHRHMAEDLGISVRTIQRWLNAYRARGLKGLKIRWVPGRSPKIPEAWAPEILGWITHGPAGCGLDRANWTYEELATYLYRRKGLTVSATTMRTFCQRHSIRPDRPTYQYLKADPEQQARAGQDLLRLKKADYERFKETKLEVITS
jgi:transposase